MQEGYKALKVSKRLEIEDIIPKYLKDSIEKDIKKFKTEKDVTKTGSMAVRTSDTMF